MATAHPGSDVWFPAPIADALCSNVLRSTPLSVVRCPKHNCACLQVPDFAAIVATHQAKEQILLDDVQLLRYALHRAEAQADAAEPAHTDAAEKTWSQLPSPRRITPAALSEAATTSSDFRSKAKELDAKRLLALKSSSAAALAELRLVVAKQLCALRTHAAVETSTKEDAIFKLGFAPLSRLHRVVGPFSVVQHIFDMVLSDTHREALLHTSDF